MHWGGNSGIRKDHGEKGPKQSNVPASQANKCKESEDAVRRKINNSSAEYESFPGTSPPEKTEKPEKGDETF